MSNTSPALISPIAEDLALRPWFVTDAYGKDADDPGPPQFCFSEIRRSDGVTIASSWGKSYQPRANALMRLMVAAPETRAALVEADGCFEAALAEGWLDALANGDIDLIRDIWTRRIGPARHAIAVGVAAIHDAEKVEGR